MDLNTHTYFTNDADRPGNEVNLQAQLQEERGTFVACASQDMDVHSSSSSCSLLSVYFCGVCSRLLL